MTASCIVVAGIGLSLSFAPAEFLAHFGVDNPPLILLVQLCGALYLGFAMLNWMARESSIGGIYNRSLAMGNFMHFFVGAPAFLKAVFRGRREWSIWCVAAIYAILATALEDRFEKRESTHEKVHE